jgi:hypothetical protein
MDVRNWVKDNEANSYIILGIRRFNVAERKICRTVSLDLYQAVDGFGGRVYYV